MQKLKFSHKSLFPSTTYYFLILSGILLLVMAPFCDANAQGDLMIMPKRVVFEGSKKTDELSLVNIGKDTSRYNISLVHYRMKDDGSFEEITKNDSTERFADKFVRFFPRSVTLAPNEAQTVRIQLTQINSLLPGEYRSHLYFRAVKNQQPLGEKEIKKDSLGLSIRLFPVFGISIPVIIRVGESTAKVSLTKCSFKMAETKKPLLSMTLNRTGNMSVYGDITVDYLSPEGKEIRVATLKGLAVYTPNEERNIKIGLDNAAGVDYSNGKLHVVYQPQMNINQNNIAQTEVYLN